MFEFVKRVAKKVAGLTVMSSVSFVSACAYGPDPVRCVEGEGICFDEKTLQRCMEDGNIYDIELQTDPKKWPVERTDMYLSCLKPLTLAEGDGYQNRKDVYLFVILDCRK